VHRAAGLALLAVLAACQGPPAPHAADQRTRDELALIAAEEAYKAAVRDVIEDRSHLSAAKEAIINSIESTMQATIDRMKVTLAVGGAIVGLVEEFNEQLSELLASLRSEGAQTRQHRTQDGDLPVGFLLLEPPAANPVWIDDGP
jgi:hypothetical protein